MAKTPWGDETSYFFDLTPDKILKSVEKTGYLCTGRCLPLNSMENRVYEIELELDEDAEVNSVYDKSKIVKFYRPGRWTKEQITDEHDFLRDLQNHDIPVVAPEQIIDGSSIGKLEDVDIYYTIFPKVGGRIPDEMSDEQLGILGRLLARLHNVGESKVAEHRISLNAETYGVQNLKYLVDTKDIPMDLKSRYRQAVETIVEISEPMFARAEKQRVHGDCHLGNILWGSEGVFWVDFDDMVNGPCVQDMWLVIPGRDTEALRQRNVFLEGYQSMRQFDSKTLELIEPLRALRFVHFSAWIHKRWRDPSFSRAFPEFNNWNYWNEQVADLEDQIRYIRTGGDI